MTISREQVQACVYEAISGFNEEESLDLERSLDTPLLGAGSKLDSLTLVRFIVVLEQRIEDTFGRAVSLTDEKAMSQRNSPFRTLGTVTEYALGELGGKPS